jgi:carbon monoxide dehydrogenase subunit G
MKVEGNVTLRASQERVYAVFTDPAVLARVTPGVQTLTPVGEDQFQAVMKMGVAGITGTYNGEIALVAKAPPEHYELKVSGQGTPGYVRGTGVFDFAEADGGTSVRYVWDLEVGGMIAGVGQRVLGGVAKMMLGQFMKAMEKEVAS